MFLGVNPVVNLIQFLKFLSLLVSFGLNSDNNFFMAKILRVKFFDHNRCVVSTETKGIADCNIHCALLLFVEC